MDNIQYNNRCPPRELVLMVWRCDFFHFISAPKQSPPFYVVSLSVWLRGGNHQRCLTFTTQAGVGIDVSAVNSLHLSCGKAEIAPINVPLGHTHTFTQTHTRCTSAHPQHHCSPANQDLWNNNCKAPRPAARLIDQLISCREPTPLLHLP